MTTTTTTTSTMKKKKLFSRKSSTMTTTTTTTSTTSTSTSTTTNCPKSSLPPNLQELGKKLLGADVDCMIFQSSTFNVTIHEPTTSLTFMLHTVHGDDAYE